MSRAIANDMGRHMQQQICEVIARHAKVAATVVKPADVFIIMIEAAVSTVLTAAATVAANAPSEDEQSVMFDKTIEAIVAFVANDRARSLQEVAKRAGAPA